MCQRHHRSNELASCFFTSHQRRPSLPRDCSLNWPHADQPACDQHPAFAAASSSIPPSLPLLCCCDRHRPATYQWKRRRARRWRHRTTLAFQSAATTDAGSYTVTITLDRQRHLSPLAAVRLPYHVHPHTITAACGCHRAPPASLPRSRPSRIWLRPLTYQWQKNGAAITVRLRCHFIASLRSPLADAASTARRQP
jgi:hypothetical protein